MKSIYFLLSLLILTFLSACKYDNEEELYPDAPMCDLSNVTYAQDIQPLIRANCATPGCHAPGGNGPLDFRDYNNVKIFVDGGSFRDRVIVQKNMPPNKQLSRCDLDKIRTWLDAGAPNN